MIIIRQIFEFIRHLFTCVSIFRSIGPMRLGCWGIDVTLRRARVYLPTPTVSSQQHRRSLAKCQIIQPYDTAQRKTTHVKMHRIESRYF